MKCRNDLFVQACMAAVIALGCVAAAKAAAADADPIKSNGLTLSESRYVLPDEAEVLDGMKSLRETRKEVDQNARTRRQYELKLAASKNFINSSHKEWNALEERLAIVRDVNVHNRIVARMNTLLVKSREAGEQQQEYSDKLSKVGGTAEAKFFDNLVPLEQKAQDVQKKYDALAADPAIKAAIAKAGAAAAATPAVLGPSPEFATALKDLTKWRSEVESEAIPLVDEHGVKKVNVLLNGEPYPMIVDTGASAVTLPGELGDKLKLVPGKQDPEIELKLADGRTVTGHLMTLESVRVGRFTLKNVECVVLNKGLPDPATILGNTFLSHYVVKLDQAKDRLELIEIAGATTPVGKTSEKPGTIKRLGRPSAGDSNGQ